MRLEKNYYGANGQN